jgi:methionine-rich copper-binding protein CopC
MRHRSTSSRPGRVRRPAAPGAARRGLLAVALLTVLIGSLTSAPAVAGERRTPPVSGDRLASSSPKPGALVVAPPPVVTLMMPGTVVRAVATVTDGCGDSVPGAVVVAGARVSIRLAIDHAGVRHEDHSRAGGAWRVDWRTVAADGRRRSGRLPFTLAGTPRCDAGPTAAAPVVPSAAPGAGPSLSSTLLRPLFGLAGLGVLLTGVRLVVRRRASPTARIAVPAAAE